MKKATKNTHYLIIGPMLMPDGSNSGGATVSLNYLVEYLQKNAYSHELLDTQYFKKSWTKLLNPLRVLFVFLAKIGKIDVVFVNVSQFGVKTIAPVLYILTKLFGKTFVVRPFGGAMQDHYEKYAGWQKWLFHKTLLHSDIFFLQTRQLVDYFAHKGKNVQQLATSRYAPSAKYIRSNRPYQKRFIFLGHINESKGVDYILEAAKELGEDFRVHLYGHIHEEKYRYLAEDLGEVATPLEVARRLYQGTLQKQEVLPKLQKYDVLILPTHYRGEGYPGAIIEAYSLGLPVITTNWRAIPEIVEEGKTGFVISPKSTADLVAAMQRFEEGNYVAFSRNARAYFEDNFDADVVTERALKLIEANHSS